VAALDLSLFDEVAEVLRGSLHRGLPQVRCQPRRYGLKVWFGPTSPPREHYEAQVIGPSGVDGATVLALEVGFHTEHSKEADNAAVLDRLLRCEKQWRRALGPEPVAGPFLGRAEHWRRISETWPDPDLSDPDLPIELAARLGEYVTALEPLRADVS